MPPTGERRRLVVEARRQWRRVNESETLIQDVAITPSFYREGTHLGRRVWISLRVDNPQIQISSILPRECGRMDVNKMMLNIEY